MSEPRREKGGLGAFWGNRIPRRRDNNPLGVARHATVSLGLADMPVVYCNPLDTSKRYLEPRGRLLQLVCYCPVSVPLLSAHYSKPSHINRLGLKNSGLIIRCTVEGDVPVRAQGVPLEQAQPSSLTSISETVLA